MKCTRCGKLLNDFGIDRRIFPYSQWLAYCSVQCFEDIALDSKGNPKLI
jgi:hypothetical protein